MSAEAAMDTSTEDNDFNNEPHASGGGVESGGRKVTVSEALAAEGASKEQSYHSLETGRAETDTNAVD